jgi:putative serine protease PepD
MKNIAAALLGALTALGVCAAVLFAGVLDQDGSRTADSGGNAQVSAPATSKSGDDRDHGSLAELYASVKDGVVFVQAGQATGSGFVIDDDGHIVTNEHVVDGSSSFQVRVGENSQALPATLVGADASTDLAVLKIDPAQAGDLHPLELADADSVDVGETVVALGSPFGLQSTLTSGIVSALDRSIQSPGGQMIEGVVQTDAAINPGNSGGPLIDLDGRVVGVNAQIASQSGGNTGVGFAISITTVKQVVPKLKAGGGTTQVAPQLDPYGQQSPYGEQSPFGDQSPYGEQSPYGPQSPYDDQSPYGQQSPFGDQSPYGPQDPYGQQSPYGSQVDPYGYGYVIPGRG